jgi:hypothetical protein
MRKEDLFIDIIFDPPKFSLDSPFKLYSLDGIAILTYRRARQGMLHCQPFHINIYIYLYKKQHFLSTQKS